MSEGLFSLTNIHSFLLSNPRHHFVFATNPVQTRTATLVMVYLFLSTSPEFVGELEIMTDLMEVLQQGNARMHLTQICDEKEKQMLVLWKRRISWQNGVFGSLLRLVLQWFCTKGWIPCNTFKATLCINSLWCKGKQQWQVRFSNIARCVHVSTKWLTWHWRG